MRIIYNWRLGCVAAALALLVLFGVIGVACGKQGQAKSAPEEEVPPQSRQEQSSPAPEQKTPAQLLARVDEGQGGVTVEATWVTPAHSERMPSAALKEYPIDRYILIHLKLDTHSVDLAKYDLSRLATLVGRSGATAAAATWVSISDDGHHREGVLLFSGRGSAQWVSEERKAELTLKGIAGVAERVFRWEW